MTARKAPGTPAIYGTRCAMGVLLATLSPQDVKALHAALKSTMPAVSIVKALRSLGYSASVSGIHRHRRSECRCPNA